jgi:hypothetical protein
MSRSAVRGTGSKQARSSGNPASSATHLPASEDAPCRLAVNPFKSFYPNPGHAGAGASSDGREEPKISEQSYRFIPRAGIGKSRKKERHRACDTAILKPEQGVRAEKRKHGQGAVEPPRNTGARDWPRALGRKIVGQDSNLVIK